MTDFETMLNFFSPDTDYVYTSCAECGTPVSVNVHGTKRPLCEDCKREAKQETERKKYARRAVMPNRYGDPTVDLVYAVIQQALDDRDWQRKTNPDGHELSLVDCGAREFIEDGGVELWLRAIGIGLQPSLARMLNEGATYIAGKDGILRLETNDGS